MACSVRFGKMACVRFGKGALLCKVWKDGLLCKVWERWLVMYGWEMWLV